MIPRPPRRHPRREPVGVHRPLPAAPDTVAEVLERAPDVSRETSEPGPLVPILPADVDAPPLRKDQIARLEALTAVWERQVRLEGPADATLLYSAPKPPPPPARIRELPPVVDETSVTPAPAPTPDPDRDGAPGSAPARVSDWTSRHDPRSLEYAVAERLGRAVPLQDVSLDAGPVLDQGTAPPLSVHDASACVGMASAAAYNVLEQRLGSSARHQGSNGGFMMEEDARRLYELAQKRDQVHGEDYAGTSVLGGMLAGRELGLWDGFLWSLRGTRDIAQVLLQLRLAVVIGVPWSTALEGPDADGVIVPGGLPNGGHALAVVGLRLVLGRRPGPWFELQQSRGRAEGKNGRVFIHHKHLAQLLAGIGEAAVPYTEDVL